MFEPRGLIAAPFTAFNENGSVNLDAIEAQYAQLVEDGVTGVFICGTTGEGLSLTTTERKSITERWRSVAPSTFSVITHVGHASSHEARELASHAEACGVDAIAAMPSSPFDEGTIASVVRYLQDIGGGSSLPLYYYHIPSISRVNIQVHSLLSRASDEIPMLAGVKFTHSDLMDFNLSMQAVGGRYRVLFGRDEQLLGALSFGATGAVGSTYNFMAPLFNSLIQAYQAGDFSTARQLQYGAQQVIAVMRKYPRPAAQKLATRLLLGQDLGPVRTPSLDLTPAAARDLERELEAVNFRVICRGPSFG